MHSTNSESANNPIGRGHGASSHGAKSAASLSPKIWRVAAHLRQCFQQPITLRQAAAVVDIHPDYLSRRFKREIGVGLHGYLLTLRLQHATGLLVNSTKSIKEISCEVGFRAPEVFSKAFKRCMGCSPRTYRDDHLPCDGSPAVQFPSAVPPNGSL